MRGRLAAAAAVLVIVAACANVEPAGRNAGRAPAPAAAAEPAPAAPRAAPPQRAIEVPPAARAQSPPVAAPQTPVVAAPGAAAPQAPQPARRLGANDDIIVPGEVNRQVPAPGGDPRTMSERMADIRAWDRCVTEAQASGEGDPMRPQLEMPEDYCGEALGMADRSAVPISRRIPR